MKLHSIVLLPCVCASVLCLDIAEAQAYEPRAVGGCSEIRFDESPEVLIHIEDLNGFDLITAADMIGAIVDIDDEFNQIGGTSISTDPVQVTLDPFTFQSWIGGSPAIHIGFTDDPTAAIGVTSWDVDPTTCEIEEAHILFKDPSIQGWTFNEPADTGEDYYDAGITNAAGDRYFRISYVHELLHAFGLAHTNSAFAMLNYGERPWANRDPGEKIKPMPDDVRGIRYLYPDSSHRTEIAVLNTWYSPNTTSTATYPAATQHMMCAPSDGDSWATTDNPVCGLDGGSDGSTQVCGSDWIYTRTAVANYGTRKADIEMRLYFSDDDVLDAGDTAAAQVRTFRIGKAVSSAQGRRYRVPGALAAGDYTMILEAVATEVGTGTVTSDWIPLTGELEVMAGGC